ncbi:MAG: hypothetical protein K2X99_10990, partial [Gemmatimonadaceae bacterium]|nr:hypothetical protein [Gemmatimonadaceae bacterium]
MVPLFALLLQAAAVAAPQDTQSYSSPTVRALVHDAVRLNRTLPKGFGAYRARVESEVSFGNRRAEGIEITASIEQM